MGVYRQKYEDWFNNLNEQERKAETARMNSTKSIRKQPAKNNNGDSHNSCKKHKKIL